jgi:hypothetical protein
MTAPTTTERPVFVVGSPRSGTTLLRYMLCSHPRLYLPPESNFIPRYFGRDPTVPMSHGEAEAVLRGIASYRSFWRDWQGPRPGLEDLGLDESRILPATLVDALYRRYAEQNGAARWGDKTPNHAAHVQLLDTLFPTCQVIHIVRDARDVTASSLESYRGRRFFYMDAHYATRTWCRLVGTAMHQGRSLGPERYHQLRYEDLADDPVGEMRQVCAFLGEEYHPAMVTPRGEARRHHHSAGIHGQVRQPVTGARMGRWQQDLQEADQRLVQSVAAPLLLYLGYPLADLGTPSPAERLRAIALRAKFAVVDAARRLVRALGLGTPTRIVDWLPRRAPARSTPGPPPATEHP